MTEYLEKQAYAQAMINHIKQTVEMEKKIKNGTIEDTRILQTLHNET